MFSLVHRVGDAADQFQSVPCNFENSHACRYVTSELSAWRWSREAGKDDNPSTGPEADSRGNPFG